MTNKETAIFVRVTNEQKDALRRLADTQDVSISKIVRDLIKDFLRKIEQREIDNLGGY